MGGGSIGFGVGVTLGWGLVTGLSDLDSCLDRFSLVKTTASAMTIASRITATTTTAIMSRRL